MRRIGGVSSGSDSGLALHGGMINDTADRLPGGCRAESIASVAAGAAPGNRETRRRPRPAAAHAVPGVSA